ncbi:MAG: histidine phosphatase family protein [Ruminococcaceae bacterium]|nr:histidine phosphatase family protein [Oscillospiraceae bacterium]
MTKIILVRHGESQANLDGYIAGHTDVPLSALGVKQAMETAAHLASEQIDAVYTSDLCRASATARPHAELRGLPVIEREELREIFCGRWEGESFKGLEEREHELYVNGFRNRFFGFRMPEGESTDECGARFYNAVLKIAKAHEGGSVLIASHGAVIRSFWAIIRGLSHEEANETQPYPSNASYSVAEFDGERFCPVEFSHDSHLSAVTHLNI